jgi:hypothetical protein
MVPPRARPIFPPWGSPELQSLSTPLAPSWLRRTGQTWGSIVVRHRKCGHLPFACQSLYLPMYPLHARRRETDTYTEIHTHTHTHTHTHITHAHTQHRERESGRKRVREREREERVMGKEVYPPLSWSVTQDFPSEPLHLDPSPAFDRFSTESNCIGMSSALTPFLLDPSFLPLSEVYDENAPDPHKKPHPCDNHESRIRDPSPRTSSKLSSPPSSLSTLLLSSSSSSELSSSIAPASGMSSSSSSWPDFPWEVPSDSSRVEPSSSGSPPSSPSTSSSAGTARSSAWSL